MHRRLSRYEILTLRLHLMICSACRRYRSQVLRIRRAMLARGENPEAVVSGAAGSEAISPEEALPHEAREHIAEALRRRSET